MVRVRVSFSLCLVVLLFCGLAAGQIQRTAKYTAVPETWDKEKTLREEASWLVKIFPDPAAALKEDPDRFLTFLSKREYELPSIAQMSSADLRTELSRVMVEKAFYDPMFTAIFTIANTEMSDRLLAVQSLALLCNATKTYVGEFPGLADPVREVLLARLANGPDEVKYIAIGGLAAVKNAQGSSAVTEALIGQLSSNSQLIIQAAAKALGEIGDPAAVRPLMETFLAIPEGVDPTQSDEGQSSMLPGEPGPPLNEARLEIAISVGLLTGIDRDFRGTGMYQQSEVFRKYEDMVNWWEQNKDKYK